MIYNNSTGLENNTLPVNINILHNTQVHKEINRQFCNLLPLTCQRKKVCINTNITHTVINLTLSLSLASFEGIPFSPLRLSNMVALAHQEVVLLFLFLVWTRIEASLLRNLKINVFELKANSRLLQNYKLNLQSYLV